MSKRDTLQTIVNWGTALGGAYFIGIAIAGAIKRRKEKIEGIGAAKRRTRRIWNEVADAQRMGIDLTDPNGWQKNAAKLRRMSEGKLSRANSDKPDEQRYFNQLRRAYKSIAGTGLPHDQSVVRNEYGDVVLIYNDYHLDELPQTAARWMMDNASSTDDADYGHMATIAAIASGDLKFVWKSKGIHEGLEALLFGTPHPSERKARISYLASPDKGGVYPKKWAHTLWERAGGRGNDKDILDGVLDAVLTYPSVGAAQQRCIDMFLQAHQADEPLMFEDVPF